MSDNEFSGVTVIKETTRACLCAIGGEEYWVPRGQIMAESDLRNGLLVVTPWYAEKMTPNFAPTEKSTQVDDFRSISLVITADQRKIVMEAISRVRIEANNPDLPEGRALELICADFLAGLDPLPTGYDGIRHDGDI